MWSGFGLQRRLMQFADVSSVRFVVQAFVAEPDELVDFPAQSEIITLLWDFPRPMIGDVSPAERESR